MEKPVVIANISIQTDSISSVINKILTTKKPLRMEQINPEMIVQAKKGNYQTLINSADIRVANGVGVVAKMTKQTDASVKRFTSSSFTLPLLAKAPNNWRVLLVGSPKNSTIVNTESFLAKKFPNLHFDTFDSKDMNEQKTKTLLELVENNQYNLMLLGLGFPKQSVIGKEILQNISSGVVIGEGGTFDYDSFGGNIKRAPKFVQNVKLEWLWRLVQEPSRLPRYFRLIEFLWISRNNT